MENSRLDSICLQNKVLKKDNAFNLKNYVFKTKVGLKNKIFKRKGNKNRSKREADWFDILV
jgi:hypothetical protein